MEKRKAMRRNSRKESRKIQMLSEEERYVQAITALLTFGVFRYIVLPLLDDLNKKRKLYFAKKEAKPAGTKTEQTPPSEASGVALPLNAVPSGPDPPANSWNPCKFF
jgi:hypothetical protein